MGPGHRLLVEVALHQRHSNLAERGPVLPSLASNTTRRVVGQWGGAGGAVCEDHLCLGGVGLRVRGGVVLASRALQDASELAAFSAHATRLARLQPRSRAGTIVPQKNCRSEPTVVRSCARAPSSQEANQRRLLFPLIRGRRGATKHARTVRDSSAKRASSARRAATTETVRGA